MKIDYHKIPFILLGVLIAIFFFIGCQSNESTALVQSSESVLGQRLTFPKGYRLAGFAEYNTDMTVKVIYICQSKTNEDDYRICIPKTHN